ncbi:unnamed protein product [Schistocephalus solidus]|uniref:Uncharacterized protein n=1 Tax=Schistocephalus solidus TaxID=70667 RepID=A0A183TMQ8_SCHSO|nr:unnamed protein product [Schistocephalus solidus]
MASSTAASLHLPIFNLMFSAILTDSNREERPRIRVAYRINGQLLIQRRMYIRSPASTATIQELLFADEFALNATTEEEMQRRMDLSAVAFNN